MSWQQVPIKAPLVDGIEDVASGLSSVISQISPLLDTATSLLEAVKIFFQGGGDPFSILANLVLDELENLNNDIFGTGVFELIINPLNVPVPNALSNVNGRIDPFVNGFFKQIPQLPVNNSLGFEFVELTPGRAISLMKSSLDDLGDINRPQFSDGSQVTAFGFMLTFPTVEEFVVLYESFRNIWKVDEFEKLLTEVKEKQIIDDPTTGLGGSPAHRHTYVVDGEGNGKTIGTIVDNNNKVTSHQHTITSGVVQKGSGAANHTHPLNVRVSKGKKPDWSSIRFNQIELLKETQDLINRSIEYARGLLTTADDAIGDLITIIEKKLDTLKTIVEDLNELIDIIKNALLASGVYLLDLPPTVGGNNALKDAFDDAELRKLTENKFTAAYIIVGGGPSLTTVNTIRELLT